MICNFAWNVEYIDVVLDQLDDALEEYEILDSTQLTHRIVKRSLETGRTHTRQLNFNALGR